MRGLRVLNVTLLAVLVLGALLYWGGLPERVPTHFNARGLPDAWSPKSFMSWFLLPTIAVLTVGIMYLSMWAVRRRPVLLNIPQKKEFLALSPEDQAPVIREVTGLLELVTLVTLLILCSIQLATYRAAFGLSVRGLMLGVLGISVAGLPALTIVLLVRTQSAINAARRRAKLQGRLPHG